ncbi:Uu.00g122860.m01.CDS01 [Anthostomella pinea]|uniref:Uu.00g122860.m01.CDS01 n=1 Tax=Anthostomella pinea TaxID=933095 RepID=A0AAI8YHK7_9PEZI|nr:Uu.00g122860.m01.CDS01 [Anthostomella pinea]
MSEAQSAVPTNKSANCEIPSSLSTGQSTSERGQWLLRKSTGAELTLIGRHIAKLRQTPPNSAEFRRIPLNSANPPRVEWLIVATPKM